MSLQFARRAAEKLLESMPKQCFTTGPNESGIDPKEIAIRLHVQVYEDKLEDGVSGLLITNGGRSTIFVNSKDKLARQRFSIAHELGHFLLRHHAKEGDHVHVDKGVRVLQRGLKASQGVDPIEIEANHFAACLLMPANLLRQTVEELGGRPVTEEMVDELAKRFVVSEQAMTIRLTNLGYVD